MNDQPRCDPTLTLNRPFSLVHENGLPGYNSQRPCWQDSLHARHRVSWSADNTTVTAGRMLLIAGRNPDGNGKPVAKIKAIRRHHFVFDCYASAALSTVESTTIRTERRPIVLGLRTFDYYREQVVVRVVKLVRLLRLIVVVVKLVVVVVVVVKPLVSRRRLLLRRWRWFAANPMSSWYTIFFFVYAVTALGGEDSSALRVQHISTVQSQHWERAAIVIIICGRSVHNFLFTSLLQSLFTNYSLVCYVPGAAAAALVVVWEIFFHSTF